MKNLALLLDCARNATPNISMIKKLLFYMSRMGYTQLMLYMEDNFTVEGEEYFGYMRAKYSPQQIQEIIVCAEQFQIEVVPCVQTLAHLNQIFRWKEYQAVQDTADILLVGEERTYELIENIFKSIKSQFRSRNINIGMDEAHMLGLGKYLQKNGLRDKMSIMVSHVERVLALAKKHGLRPVMWSDMYFRIAYGDYYNAGQEKREMTVPDVGLIYWAYDNIDKAHYDKMFLMHKELSFNVQFACGAWRWSSFAPDNTISLAAQSAGITSALENGIEEVIVTCWGDDGGEASVYSVLPAICHAACLYHKKDTKEVFFELFGIPFDDFMLIDNLNRIGETKAENLSNYSKCLLYSDLFYGFLDSNVTSDMGKWYKQLSVSLEKVDGKEFSYMFDTMRSLCKVLIKKAEFGKNLRVAYHANDKKTLKEMAAEIDGMITDIEVFFECFKNQWYFENMQTGFEVQEIRFGGLIRRLSGCRELLEMYLRGEISRIEGLEEVLLDVMGKDNQFKKADYFYFNNWEWNVSLNRITFK